MKIPYYFGMSIMLLLANIPNSYSSYSDIHLIKQIKPYTFAKSKPAFSYPKFAAVSFLKSDSTIEFKGSLDVKSQCGALGYIIPKSKCTGDMKPSRLCSDDPSMASVAGAGDYTTGCCDSKLYTVTENAECPNNAAKLSNDSCYWGGEKKYRCACDRGRYQYSTIKGEWCGTIKGTNIIDYTRFNANLACSAYEPRTKQNEMYFISCCPGTYSKCDANNHEVGRGNECRVITNIVTRTIEPRYEECVCASHYDTECPSDRVINGSLKCIDKNNRIWTPESNCESACSKTIETNIDSYLYKKIWHCLYRKDGAVVRDIEDKAGICGVFDDNSNSAPYDDCIAQGYNKREADCYNAATILRCPNDSTKVWCLEGKYCTGYDVGSYDGINYCTEGANIEMCPSTDKGLRCQYKNEKCNCMWNDGEFDATLKNCLKYFSNAQEAQTFATSPTIDGNDETCCYRGYKMELGKCVKNICNRNLYPYDQRPGEEMGKLEVCYEGDKTVDLGYKAYFGYNSCHGDATLGQKWIRKSEKEYVCPDGSESCAESEKVLNADYHQCVCARDGQDGRIKLPFGSDLFFDVNTDTSDNYVHVGFNKGDYGEQVDCTDAEGSYYGYKACYIGSKMRIASGTPTGMCLVSSAGSSTFANYNQSLPYINRIFNDAGLPSIDLLQKPITNKLGDPSKVFCINPTQHCPNGDPEQCDESIKPLLIDGCINGWEEECSAKCYHINNLVKEGGIYKLNPSGVKMTVRVYDNGLNNERIRMGYDQCPIGYLKANISCLKLCSIENLKNCQFPDLVTLYSESELYNADGSSKFTLGTIDKTKVVGIVFARDGQPSVSCGTSGKLHITSLRYINDIYSAAAAYPTSNTFKQAVGEQIYNLGTWRMPTSTEASNNCYYQNTGGPILNNILSALGAGSMQMWTSTPYNYRNCCWVAVADDVTKMHGRAVMTLDIN